VEGPPPSSEPTRASHVGLAVGSTPTAIAAIIDFITGSLIENPRRAGRELRNELAGIHSARRGSYRVLYRIDESERTVTVLRIDHRGDVFRTP
jgi:mRNA-degrading endonuclease RelE of RelBE toxin-antitoxin system